MTKYYKLTPESIVPILSGNMFSINDSAIELYKALIANETVIKDEYEKGTQWVESYKHMAMTMDMLIDTLVKSKEILEGKS